MLAQFYHPFPDDPVYMSQHPPPAPCEVLYLSDLSVETVDVPFWDCNSGRDSYPSFHGHVVAGDVLYVVVSRCLYGLDMVNLEWSIIDDRGRSASLSLMMYQVSFFRNSNCSSVVRGGKSFLVKMVSDLEESLFLKEDRDSVVELDDLSEFVRKETKDYFINGLAVVPFGNDGDENSNVFCIFMWYRNYEGRCDDLFRICRITVVDNGALVLLHAHLPVTVRPVPEGRDGSVSL
ncbi:unnamed protein product [Linum trigynum]|uniref:Uncharacterized protein n=1 Tax=Linum trigynum TaxID=586398 RepID=A0AAV2FBZ5_9ROSI